MRALANVADVLNGFLQLGFTTSLMDANELTHDLHLITVMQDAHTPRQVAVAGVVPFGGSEKQTKRECVFISFNLVLPSPIKALVTAVAHTSEPPQGFIKYLHGTSARSSSESKC